MEKEIENGSKRGIKELRKLPIDELTDEEIVTTIRDLFKSKFALIAYESKGSYLFLSAYSRGGKLMISNLQKAWEEKFGNMEIL